MVSSTIRVLAASIMVLLLGSTGTASAALIVTANDTANGNQQAFAGTVLSNDLINQGSPSFVSAVQTNYNPFGSSDPANTVLNDGVIGPNTTGATNVGSAFDLDGTFQVTYNLDLALSPEGYSLTRIRSYAAHLDNRTGQNYEVLVDYINDGLGNFVSLGSFVGSNAGGTNQASRLTLENDVNSGIDPFAVGVAAIRFSMNPASPATTVWRELDVEGFATPAAIVPEPASAALWCLIGGLGLLAYRRCRRK